MIDMSSTDALRALAVETRRRGVTYGKLVATTTGPEQWEIVRRYIAGKKGKGRGRKQAK